MYRINNDRYGSEEPHKGNDRKAKTDQVTTSAYEIGIVYHATGQ
jgi:hypothetical protein